MINYLINATAIWLISLLVYDVLLHRESFHAYNRWYLLATLIAGMALPLIPVLPAQEVHVTLLQSPARTMATARQAIIAAAPATTAQSSSISWLAIIYLSGLVSGIAYLVVNMVKLLSYYRQGKKKQQGRWTIVETGKGHAPFSFRYRLFVNSIEEYNAQEWQMICMHEEAHTQLVHIADLLLLHAARIAFWFHPLVYVYNMRLLMVHEYQADTAAATEKESYGHFLIEQALLHAAPSVAHSFHYSPIKNRLVMLHKISGRKARGKMLLLAPLMMIFVACFAKDGGGRKMVQDNYSFTYPGTKVEMSKTQIDTIMMTDPVTNVEIMRVMTVDPIPMTVNGMSVQYKEKQAKGPVSEMMNNNAKKMEDYLLNSLKPLLEKLNDGKYFYGPGNSVVGTDGKLVYYQYWGIRTQGTDPIADTALVKEIDRKTISLMETMPRLDVWKFNKQAAPYAIDGFFGIQVINHKIVRQ